MKCFAVGAVLITALFSQAVASDNLEKAQNLGSILAAESMCGFTYKKRAISRWIDENTDPSDMGFASTLQLMTDGASFNQNGMSESSRTAHCRSVERSARHFEFIE